ncbi:hypothetical protein GGP53_003150 [Salinibacter ruber]|nr:hypothetical protein [Salinibacter ruber]MCS4146178.1 hypothetical protein [Salinibacter ruber]
MPTTQTNSHVTFQIAEERRKRFGAPTWRSLPLHKRP